MLIQHVFADMSFYPLFFFVVLVPVRIKKIRKPLDKKNMFRQKIYVIEKNTLNTIHSMIKLF